VNADGECLAPTEAVASSTRGLDTLATGDLVETLVRESRTAFDAVAAAAPSIALAVDAIVERLQSGGTLHYVGAGTSGRLGVLDAAECPPTFGTSPSFVVGHIAGGPDALVRAVEGAEDDALAGQAQARALDPRDALVAISASGGAPYVVAFARAARERGVRTIALASDARSALVAACELAIVVATGAEPLSGSTRMNAGTAQKLALNAISTATMVRLGKVYDNLMVDVVASNEKLRARAVRLVRALTACDDREARALLERAGGSVKVAVVIARTGLESGAARDLLARNGDSLRRALERTGTS
jgi:N-acetylmuramic acid 6-phosphate etherase